MSDNTRAIPCPVCGERVSVRSAHGRKSGKAFISLVCVRDGRHFRGFIGDRSYVERIVGLAQVGKR